MAESALEPMIDRLERAAEQLRDGELSAAQAAELVEECARMAAAAAEELDREVRAADVSMAPDDQLELGGA